MSVNFKVRDEVYYDDSSGRGRVPELDIESQADVIETSINMLISEELS